MICEDKWKVISIRTQHKKRCKYLCPHSCFILLLTATRSCAIGEATNASTTWNIAKKAPIQEYM